MNVANLELCKELYELSGWEDTRHYWHYISAHEEYELDNGDPNDRYPAYDLSYLLWKLPKEIDRKLLEVRACVENRTTMEGWLAFYSSMTNEGNMLKAFDDTPEDAACKLAIELFKLGILKREDLLPCTCKTNGHVMACPAYYINTIKAYVTEQVRLELDELLKQERDYGHQSALFAVASSVIKDRISQLKDTTLLEGGK